MKQLRRALAVVLLLAAACERRKAPLPADSAILKPVGDADSASVTHASSWNPTVGPLMLIAADEPSRAFVLLPDSLSATQTISALPHPASVTLFGRGGTVQTAELPLLKDTSACLVATLSASPPPRPWSIGFLGGVISPVGMDSTTSLTHADSVTLVTWMNRLASGLPNDSAGRFSGLPFVVQVLWRLPAPNGRQVTIATLARQINQEATPLQERTFLIAERAPTDTAFVLAYSERSYGAEETIENREVLGAALLGANRNVAVIVERDFGDDVAYGLIERGDDNRWRARWSGPRRRC